MSEAGLLLDTQEERVHPHITTTLISCKQTLTIASSCAQAELNPQTLSFQGASTSRRHALLFVVG
jgi:hypothetical protein